MSVSRLEVRRLGLEKLWDNANYSRRTTVPGEPFLEKEASTFVSYSRDDGEFASRLAQDLKQAGGAIWIDKLDIHPGAMWERALEEALTNCSRVLVILSPASVGSENVMAEVAFGLDEKKEIIPVLYRDCKIPLRLRPIQYIDFRKEQDYKRALGELLSTLGRENAPGEVDSSGIGAARNDRVPRAVPILNGRIRRLNPFWMKMSTALAIIVAAGWSTYSILSRGGPGIPQPRASQTADSQRATPETTPPDASSHAGPQVAAVRRSVAEHPAAIPKSGWAVGLGGVTLHTEDGGNSWSAQSSGITEQLVFATFIAPRIGWVVGNNGAFLHTEDGGVNWLDQSATIKQHVASTYKHYLASVAFPSPQAGWITGGDGLILHTEDGGVHWLKQYSGTGETLYCVVFPNPQSGWIVGSAGTVLHTDDGGRNWSPQQGGTEHTLYSASFPTPTSGWAVGTDGAIVHTENAGINWKAQKSGTNRLLSSTAFPTPTSGWAVGNHGTIVHTDNGGANWKPQSSGTAVDLNSVWFAGEAWGWASGDRGVLLHTGDGGASWKLLQPSTNPDLILNAITFLRAR